MPRRRLALVWPLRTGTRSSTERRSEVVIASGNGRDRSAIPRDVRVRATARRFPAVGLSLRHSEGRPLTRRRVVRRALDGVSLRVPRDSARPSPPARAAGPRPDPRKEHIVNTPVSAAAHRAAQPNRRRRRHRHPRGLPRSRRRHRPLAARGARQPRRTDRRPRLTFPVSPAGTRPAPRWNLAVDQRPARGRRRRQRRRHRAHRAHRQATSASPSRPQATGHNAGPLAADNGLADAILLRMSRAARRRGRRRPAHRPRRARRPVGRRRRRGRAARTRPRSPGRRTTSASSATRSAAASAGSPARYGVAANHVVADRTRHRRRRTPPGRRRPRARAVLGAARRRRRLRCRHRARVPPVRDRRDRRRHAALADRARRGGAAGLGRVDRRACPTP